MWKPFHVPDVNFRFCKGLGGWLVALAAWAVLPVAAEPPVGEEPGVSGPGKVMVVPIRAEISPPELYILRRGIREAIEAGADTLILDMETPGGRLDVTFDILQALERFPGRTVTYVNREAISAGALIAMGTDEIWFKPGGLIGAAAPVMSGGAEIGDTMKAKIISYLLARARSITEGQGYRSEVITAMIDVDYELKIGEEVISPKGALLTLTSTEAAREFGDPPMPLLATGIADNLDELVKRLHGSDAVVMNRLEANWSEKLAQYLVTLTPLLMGLGMMFLFIEFRTPGFGVFGILGGVFLGIVFFGHYAAGLSGYEPVILFVLGVILVLVEVLFVPGIFVGLIAGVLMILASLLWAMADFLPEEPITFSGDLLMRPLFNLVSGVLIAVLVFLALVRFLPRGGLWGWMVLEKSVAGEPGALQPVDSWAMPEREAAESRIGLRGRAVTALYPSGQVEIGGRRYEARLEVGMADPGTPVRVVRESEFALIVEVES